MNDLRHAGWRRIKYWGVVRLTHDLPEGRRWRWRTRIEKDGKKQLRLVNPRGPVWDFKLHGAAWIRLAATAQQSNTGEKHDGMAQHQS